MKKIAILFAMVVIYFTATAQKTINGKIIDRENNLPLAGATISYSGKGGTTSDKNGIFTIECGATNKITVSFIGYETVQIILKNCDEELTIGLISTSKVLNNVEISATSNQNKSLLYQPVSISKLTDVELKRQTGLFLDDAVNGNIPGVTMNRRSVSGGQQFNIRGYGNGTRGTRGISSNFDGQGYKVYLNGIPVTDAEGITTMDDLDFGSIGNVEITKGPSGTLYGLAIAGAVNLKTIKAEKGTTSAGQDIMIGNYGLQRYTTHFQTGTDKSSLLINYGNQKSDGFTIHNKSHKDFVNIAGEFQPNEKQFITTYFGFSNSYDERFGELTLAQYANKDYSGNIDYIKRNGHSHVITFRGGFGHTYSFNKNISNTTTIFGTGFTSDVSSAGGWTDKNTINYGIRILSGITGIETQTQNGQTIGYNMKQNPADASSTWVWGNPYWVVNATTSNTAVKAGTTSLFTEWTLALPKDFSVTGGIGVSNMKIFLDDRLNPETTTKPSHYEKIYKSMVSPHVAINKVFSKEFSLYAAYSKGYKAPVSSLFYITTPVVTTPATPATGRLNNELKPEIGNQFEIGTKGVLLNSRLSYQFAIFHAKFSNKMTAVAVQLNNTTTAYSYVVNGGDQDDKGIETLIKFTVYQSNKGFFNTITPFANLAYSDFKYGDNFKYQTGNSTSNITTVDYSGKPVGGVSKITANLGVNITTLPGIYFNFIYNYKHGVPITSDGIYKSSSYNLINGKIGYQKSISHHIDLDFFFGINNITGTQYPYMVFVNQLPDAYLPAPPKANYFGGLTLKYRIK